MALKYVFFTNLLTFLSTHKNKSRLCAGLLRVLKSLFYLA